MLNPRNVFKPIYIGSPTGHSNHCTFLISLGSITEELPLQMTRLSGVLSIVGFLFTLEWGGEMHLESFSQGLSLDLALVELEPGASWFQD